MIIKVVMIDEVACTLLVKDSHLEIRQVVYALDI